MTPFSHRRRVDGFLAIGIVSLVLFGTVMIYSASVIVSYTKYGDAQYFFKHQLVSAVLGFIAMVVLANIDYRNWERQAKLMLIGTFLLLLSVFVFTRGEINGAHRWIIILGQNFQPSELVKITFAIYLAAWLAQRMDEVSNLLQTFVPFVAVLAAISGLMLAEPDFGTLTVLFAIALSIYFAAGMTWKQFIIGVVILGVSITAIIAEPYRRARVMAFLNPEEDTSGAGYQIKNISIAIGSGGWFGVGFGQSGQKRLFLPEPHTDSIFAVTVEELGFVVGALVVLMLTFVFIRGYRVAARAPDPFGRLLATGITSWFAYQAFLNLSAMLQLVPLKGVPLPFISYGGTNLLMSLAAAGILLNISRYGVDEAEKHQPTGVRPRKHHKSTTYGR